MLSAFLNCSAYPLHILSSSPIKFYTNILTTTLYIVQKNLFCKFLNIPKYHNSPILKKSHREHAVTFLTQPGESARLITFHTKKLALLKKRKRCPEGTLLKRPLWDFPTVYQNAKFLYDS